MRNYSAMKKLILALAATLIAAPAVAKDHNPYYDRLTKGDAPSCATFIRVTQSPPPDEEISDAEWTEAGHFCFFAVLAWLDDTGRFEGKEGPTTDAEIARGRCGAHCATMTIRPSRTPSRPSSTPPAASPRSCNRVCLSWNV